VVPPCRPQGLFPPAFLVVRLCGLLCERAGAGQASHHPEDKGVRVVRAKTRTLELTLPRGVVPRSICPWSGHVQLSLQK
jgi:hypothetical protein